jgi:hypothetical protein
MFYASIDLPKITLSHNSLAFPTSRVRKIILCLQSGYAVEIGIDSFIVLQAPR